MVCILKKFLRDASHQAILHLTNVLARGDAGSIGDPENMCINRHGGLAKGGVEYDIRCFPPDTWECLEFFTRPWNLTLIAFTQNHAGLHDVFRFGIIQSNRFNTVFDTVESEGKHGRGGIGSLE